MKKSIYLLILSIVIVLLTGCKNRDNNHDIAQDNNFGNIEVQKLETEIENTNNKDNIDNNGSIENNQESSKKEPTEEALSSFSTKILAKEKNRVDNINIACTTINGTIINSGATFSFWNTLGNPTAEKGYKEAKAFTNSGGVTTAIGGGLCQVSSTIYNVVLNVQGLETVERHQHTREVYYVKLGKDASVSYGSADFRFKNNLSNSIKIYAECTGEAINIRFVKLV